MSPKNPAAVALGRKGGQATAENRTAAERSEAARKAVLARWEKDKKQIDKSLRDMNKNLDRIEGPAKKRSNQKKEKASK